jgi:hypothetical protein
MNSPKPTRKGYMLDLWNCLKPNHAYRVEEINSLSNTEGLPPDTTSNLIYTSINQKRGYLIFDQATGCYFRSDSNMLMDAPQSSSDEVAIARNIVAICKQLQDYEEERTTKVQQVENLNQEVKDLDQKIAAIKEQLKPLRDFFPASAA